MSAPLVAEPVDRVRVVELALSADLASAAVDGAVFVRALRELERVGPRVLGPDVAAIAALAERDLPAASAQWEALRSRLDDAMTSGLLLGS